MRAERRQPDPPDTLPPWHALSAPDTLGRLDVESGGLTDKEADCRQVRYGRNELPQSPPTPAWVILVRQLRNPIIYVLGIAAAVALLSGHGGDAGFIAAVVVVNSLVGAVQEHRADRSARALRQLMPLRGVALRDGEARELDARELVPGDVILLESGNRVPADVRLLTCHGTEIDESLLTGESVLVVKDSGWSGPAATPVADRRNMAFAGSMIAHGRSKAVVVATGRQTEIGRLALDVIQTPPGRPPLLIRLERFTHAVGAIVLMATLAVAAIGVIVHGHSIATMFMFGVALAVSAIPEGLPVAITVALAVAARRMAQRGVLVRRLHAVEGLGSCTMIASDKTGTLTCNELTVRELRLSDGRALRVSGEGFAPIGTITPAEGALPADSQAIARGENPVLDELLRAAVLCNEAGLQRADGVWGWHGDPTDVALLSAAHKAGWLRERALDDAPQIDEIPFEPERRFAATYHQVGPRVLVTVKGAPERVLGMCAGSAQERARFEQAAHAMAERGQRVLALASGWMDPLDPDREEPPAPHGLRFWGLAGMTDPLRPGAREAVQRCVEAGVTVCMVTGDHPITALAIARELGLAERAEQVLTGQQIDAASDAELERLVRTVRVFARVAPHQKLRIVEAAQRAGHFVAVTGDGANDAPALRAANIGVAMGRAGTDVGRESAELIISDDNFATIVAGIEEGRVAYDNIRKVVLLLASTGAAEIVIVALAVAAGTPLPLLAVQLLWLNLVTNGIQDVALAFEPGEGDVMHKPPRSPRDPLINRLMIANTITGCLVMGLIGFGAFVWMLGHGWTEAAARNGLLLLMVLFENVHIGNCRSETKSAFYRSPLRSPFLFCGALGAFLLHLLAMHVPVTQRVLGVAPVGLAEFVWLAALALTPLIALEIQKLILRRRGAGPGDKRPSESTIEHGGPAPLRPASPLR